MLIDQIVKRIPVGTGIPKPESKRQFTFQGEVRVATERAIAYAIPSSNKENSVGRKKITASQLEKAYRELCSNGEVTKAWWVKNVTESDNEGGCNFTTFGGLLILLGEAERAGRGKYRRVNNRSSSR
jgi:hypothetical protein